METSDEEAENYIAIRLADFGKSVCQYPLIVNLSKMLSNII